MSRAFIVGLLLATVASMLACTLDQQNGNSGLHGIEIVYSSQQCSASSVPEALWLRDATGLRDFISGSTQTQIGFPRSDIPVIDFSEYAALALHMGRRNTGGYALQLAEPMLRIENGTATIRVDWIEPPPGAFVTQVLTSPCLVLAVPRGDYARLEIVDQAGQIRFEPAVP